MLQKKYAVVDACAIAFRLRDRSAPQRKIMSSRQDLPIKPGEVLLAKYRVERILGAGGMGAVAEVTHLA